MTIAKHANSCGMCRPPLLRDEKIRIYESVGGGLSMTEALLGVRPQPDDQFQWVGSLLYEMERFSAEACGLEKWDDAKQAQRYAEHLRAGNRESCDCLL